MATIVIKPKGQGCDCILYITCTLCIVDIHLCSPLCFYFSPGVDPHVLRKRDVKPTEPNQLTLMCLHCLERFHIFPIPRYEERQRLKAARPVRYFRIKLGKNICDERLQFLNNQKTVDDCSP